MGLGVDCVGVCKFAENVVKSRVFQHWYFDFHFSINEKTYISLRSQIDPGSPLEIVF